MLACVVALTRTRAQVSTSHMRCTVLTTLQASDEAEVYPYTIARPNAVRAYESLRRCDTTTSPRGLARSGLISASRARDPSRRAKLKKLRHAFPYESTQAALAWYQEESPRRHPKPPAPIADTASGAASDDAPKSSTPAADDAAANASVAEPQQQQPQPQQQQHPIQRAPLAEPSEVIPSVRAAHRCATTAHRTSRDVPGSGCVRDGKRARRAGAQCAGYCVAAGRKDAPR